MVDCLCQASLPIAKIKQSENKTERKNFPVAKASASIAERQKFVNLGAFGGGASAPIRLKKAAAGPTLTADEKKAKRKQQFGNLPLPPIPKPRASAIITSSPMAEPFALPALHKPSAPEPPLPVNPAHAINARSQDVSPVSSDSNRSYLIIRDPEPLTEQIIADAKKWRILTEIGKCFAVAGVTATTAATSVIGVAKLWAAKWAGKEAVTTALLSTEQVASEAIASELVTQQVVAQEVLAVETAVQEAVAAAA